MQLIFLIVSFIMLALVFWLGLYLLRRDAGDPRLLWTGVGLLLYTAVLATLVVQAGRWSSVPDGWPPQFWWLLSLPAVAWTGATVHLLPDGPTRTHMYHFWLYGEVPLTVLLAPLFLVAGVTGDIAVVGWLFLVQAVFVLLPLVVGVAVSARQSWRASPRLFSGLLWVAALFFALSMIALLLPLVRINPLWLVLAIGGDLLLLGLAICGLDAFDQGETLLPDLLLSLDGALLYALFFCSPVVATMLLSTGATPAMLLLLSVMLAVAIAAQVFASEIQSGLDRVALVSFPGVREERTELRMEVDELPRQTASPIVDTEDHVSFSRLTRRALSQMNDLTKLSGNPLTELTVIERRLEEAGVATNQTSRTNELRALLIEAIAAMKPMDGAAFGTTGQWRFYNALYYPYVIGLRPYSRRGEYVDLDETTQQALNWFRGQVPQRTLYNWQKIGAQWVARYLRELDLPSRS